MSDIAKLKDEIKDIKYNPAAIQRKMLDTLEKTYKGELDVVDPTNPFVFLLEASSVLSSAAMSEAESLTRKQYPSMALTEDELYLHMSDKDFLNRFATPARTYFKVLFHKQELENKAVDSEVTGVRKLVIPRHTEFTVAEIPFTLQYPIEIRVMGHGGLQVVYDVSEPSPLETIQTNMLDWEIVNLQGEDYLLIDVPALQMKLDSRIAQLNKATAFAETYPLDGQYYYCRVFANMENGWQEIQTTHTEQVFDPHTPTVALRVYEKKIRVVLPHVYNTTKLVDKEMRIDIYTTKGKMDLMLENYTPSDFEIRWVDAARKSLGRYTVPLQNFNSMTMFSDSLVMGGSNGVDFDTLRDQVIDNALGDSNIPITNNQMLNRLESLGYTPILSVDNITNRIYLASRELPDPRNIEKLNSIGCYFGRVQGRFIDFVNHRGVVDNQDRITLTPDVLYQEVDGITFPVNDVKRDALEKPFNSASDSFISALNEGKYSFSPFYYVLDTTGSQFDARCYHLNDPKVQYRRFIDENDTLAIMVSTTNIKVYRESNRYTLRVKIFFGREANSVLRDKDDFIPQLGVRPLGESSDIFIEGTSVGEDFSSKYRIYDFHILTDYDVTKEHGLVIKNLDSQGTPKEPYRLDLTSSFILTYYVKREKLANVDTVENTIDFYGQMALGRVGYVAAVQEGFSVKFGEFLEGFWENARALASSIEYQTYESDRVAQYNETIYKRDPVTGAIALSRGEDGDWNAPILHRKGDPVVDGNGDVVYHHRKGDVIVDSEGRPVVAKDRQVLHEVDVFLLDARFKYANQKDIMGFVDNTIKSLVVWLREDIARFQEWALEQTRIMLYPRRTLGTTIARVEENEEVAFDLEQSLTVTYYLGRSRYMDNFLRETLSDLTSEVINKHLEKKRVVKNEIIKELTERVDSDVYGLDVSGLGGGANYNTITLLNNAERCSVRKKLYRTLENTWDVVEDIRIVFIRHEDT